MPFRAVFLFSTALILAGAALAPTAVLAMLQNLDEEQRAEAILYGRNGARMEVTDFIKEWSVDKGKDGFAFITTEFLALAYAGRQAAERKVDLNAFDIEDTLAKSSGRLVFRVTLFGGTEDFTKDFSAVLQAGDQIIPAAYWTNPAGEPFGDGKSRPAFVADIDYYFPAGGIDPRGRVTLIVRDKDGKDAASFPFDLGKLR